MEEKRIHNFNQLHDEFSKFRKSHNILYRGQKNIDWELTPKVWRPEFQESNHKGTFDAWKRMSVNFIDKKIDSDWDYYALAQHHGLATRLLDWSFNPLVAAYFACEENANNDAAVYILQYNTYVNTETVKSPFEVSNVKVLRPTTITNRIVNQSGIFTVHGSKLTCFKSEKSIGSEPIKLVIDKSFTAELAMILSHYGYNRYTIYPDIEGLSYHINWLTKNREYFLI